MVRLFQIYTDKTDHIEKAETDDYYEIAGIASTPDLDLQNEIIEQHGLDLSALKAGKMYINANHGQGYENKDLARMGIIDEANVTKKGLYIKGKIWKKHPEAMIYYNEMKYGKPGLVQFSVEGSVAERDGLNKNRIRRAKVAGIALTRSPVNKNTYATLVKSLCNENITIPSPDAFQASTPNKPEGSASLPSGLSFTEIETEKLQKLIEIVKAQKNNNSKKEYLDTQILGFLDKNPKPADEDIHSLAKKLDLDTEALEERIYALLADVGKHKSSTNKEFLKRELEMGIQVEKEHTDNVVLAKEIAKDHLKEIPDYYTRLKQMEDQAKQELSKGKKAPIGTISGKYKKVAEGKWIPVKKQPSKPQIKKPAEKKKDKEIKVSYEIADKVLNEMKPSKRNIEQVAKKYGIRSDILGMAYNRSYAKTVEELDPLLRQGEQHLGVLKPEFLWPELPEEGKSVWRRNFVESVRQVQQQLGEAPVSKELTKDFFTESGKKIPKGSKGLITFQGYDPNFRENVVELRFEDGHQERFTEKETKDFMKALTTGGPQYASTLPADRSGGAVFMTESREEPSKYRKRKKKKKGEKDEEEDDKIKNVAKAEIKTQLSQAITAYKKLFPTATKEQIIEKAKQSVYKAVASNDILEKCPSPGGPGSGRKKFYPSEAKKIVSAVADKMGPNIKNKINEILKRHDYSDEAYSDIAEIMSSRAKKMGIILEKCMIGMDAKKELLDAIEQNKKKTKTNIEVKKGGPGSGKKKTKFSTTEANKQQMHRQVLNRLKKLKEDHSKMAERYSSPETFDKLKRQQHLDEMDKLSIKIDKLSKLTKSCNKVHKDQSRTSRPVMLMDEKRHNKMTETIKGGPGSGRKRNMKQFMAAHANVSRERHLLTAQNLRRKVKQLQRRDAKNYSIHINELNSRAKMHEKLADMKKSKGEISMRDIFKDLNTLIDVSDQEARKTLLKSILKELKTRFPNVQYETIVKYGLQIYEDKLLKAKKLPEGTEREWRGKKYKKQGGKWMPVKGEQKTKEKAPEGKSSEHQKMIDTVSEKHSNVKEKIEAIKQSEGDTPEIHQKIAEIIQPLHEKIDEKPKTSNKNGKSKRSKKAAAKDIRKMIGPGKTTSERGVTAMRFEAKGQKDLDAIHDKISQTFKKVAEDKYAISYTDPNSGLEIDVPKQYIGDINYYVTYSYMTVPTD